MKTKDKEQRRVMILLGAIVFLLIVIIFSSIFYIRSTRPMRQARNEAIEIALENHDRRIRKEEAEFVIKRLIKEDDPSYVITFDKNQQLIEINIDK